MSSTLAQQFASFQTNPIQERLLKEAGIASPSDPRFEDLIRANLDFCYHAELFLPDPNNPSKPLHLEDWQYEELEYAQYGEIAEARRRFAKGELKQIHVNKYFEDDGTAKRKKVAINSPRGFGKSVLASVIPVEYAVHYANTKIALFSTSQEQANELMNKVKYLLQNSVLAYMIDKKKNNESEIRLINGSQIKSFPQSEVTIRGYHPHIKVIDEKSRIKREILESAIRPMGRKTCWLEIGISTPFGRNNNHYEDCHDKKNFHVRLLGATDVSWVDDKKLKELSDVMGDRIAQQELYGQFLEDADTIFTPEWIARMLDPKLYSIKKGKDGTKYIMGCDFGKNRDWTAIFIGHMNKRGKVIVDWAERHIKVDYSEVIARIYELTTMFNIVLIVPDGNGVGIAILDELVRNVKVPIYMSQLKTKDSQTNQPQTKKGFIFTNQSKLNLVGEAERMMMKGKVKCPFHNNTKDRNDPHYMFKVLEEEMLNFTYKRTIEGNIRFTHPEDGKSHDDSLIAFMLMLWGFKHIRKNNTAIVSNKRYGFAVA